MKHTKAIFTGAVGLLALGVISTTIALYVRTPEPQSINISGNTFTNGIFTLTKDTASSSEGNFKLTPEEAYVAEFDMALSELNNYSQDVVVGKITIDVTDTNALWDYMDVSATIEGYDENSFMLKSDGEGKSNRNVLTFTTSETDVNKHTAVIEAPFDVAGTQSIKLSFALKSTVSDEDYLNKVAEKSLSYVISLGDTTDYDFAFVKGSFDDCNWDSLEKYKMVPDITASEFTWKYDNLFLKNGDRLKAAKEEYITNEEGTEVHNTIWSAGDDWVINSETNPDGTNYNITWSGDSSKGINVTPSI